MGLFKYTGRGIYFACNKQQAEEMEINALANKSAQQFSMSWSHQTWLESSWWLQAQEGCEKVWLGIAFVDGVSREREVVR